MTYRKLLELYRQGNLDEEAKKEIEQELEKFEAMNDYFFQEEEIPDLEGLGVVSEEETEANFTKMIEASIRKAFIKMGTVVGAVVLVLVLLIIFVVPKVVSWFYYDPGEVVGQVEQNGQVTDETNQMSLDMAVYTQLMLPGYFRDNVTVEDKGYGKYDFCIQQNISYNRQFHNVSGKMERNKLTLYDTNLLKRMTDNQFDWFQREHLELSLAENEAYEQEHPEEYGLKENEILTHGPVTRDQMEEKLAKLEKDKLYLAYVSLNNLMSYEEFMAFIDRMDYGSGVWCAVKCDGDDGWRPENVGFYCTLLSQSTLLSWDEETYPNLFTWHGIEPDYDKAKENIRTEAFAKEHFMSMLRYMAVQETFCEMMLLHDDFEGMAEYIEENGIEVYGFVLMDQKEDLIELGRQEEVYVMDIQYMY